MNESEGTFDDVIVGMKIASKAIRNSLPPISSMLDNLANELKAAHDQPRGEECSSELLNKAEHAIEQFERSHDGEVSIVTETDADDDSLVVKIFGGKK